MTTKASVDAIYDRQHAGAIRLGDFRKLVEMLYVDGDDDTLVYPYLDEADRAWVVATVD